MRPRLGVRPQTAADAASAIEALRLVGIDASRHQPRGLEEIDPHSFDLVVTMEPFVARKFKEKFPSYSEDRLKKWNIKDPWDNPAAYKVCAQKIYDHLKTLVEPITTPASRSSSG